MPNMDGFAFLKAIKDNTNINIPVVICSNLSDKETYAKAFAAGASAVLLKVDYSGKELVQKVNQILATKLEHPKKVEGGSGSAPTV
jgi:CheY-like chemotaxis protein